MNRSKKVTISLPSDLLERVRRVVRQGRASSVSAYVTSALRDRIQREELSALLDEMLAENGGPLTQSEIGASDRALDQPPARGGR
ncbi:MAG: hypothetical protein IT178_16585 [Acidobacteria bacterium]|nr:hypothetical protein [Acidobacteriota bacterium]